LYNDAPIHTIWDIMAPKSKDTRTRLLEPLATDLAAFRAALEVAPPEIGVIRAAVRAYIDSRIKNDRDLKKRYEAERKKLNAAKLQPIRLIKSETEPSGL
jgi:hypothetical protein